MMAEKQRDDAKARVAELEEELKDVRARAALLERIDREENDALHARVAELEGQLVGWEKEHEAVKASSRESLLGDVAEAIARAERAEAEREALKAIVKIAVPEVWRAMDSQPSPSPATDIQSK
jgi:Rad3-related DNA helicase